jgi:hypothetical protein
LVSISASSSNAAEPVVSSPTLKRSRPSSRQRHTVWRARMRSLLTPSVAAVFVVATVAVVAVVTVVPTPAAAVLLIADMVEYIRGQLTVADCRRLSVDCDITMRDDAERCLINVATHGLGWFLDLLCLTYVYQ